MPQPADPNILAIRSRRWGCAFRSVAALLLGAAALAAAGAWWAAYLIERGRELQAATAQTAVRMRALRPAPSEADNAAGPFSQACKLFRRPEENSLEIPARDAGLDFSSPPVRAWLDDNAACRAALAEALKLPACDWGSDYAKGLAGLKTADATEVRRLARFLEVAAQAEAAGGRPGPALTEALLILRLADPVCGRRTVGDVAASNDMEEVFSRALQGVLNSCDPAEGDLRRAETLLAGHLGRRPSAAGTVEFEAMLARVSIGMVASGEDSAGQFGAVARPMGRLAPEGTGLRLAWWRWSGDLLEDAGLVDQTARLAVTALDRPFPQVLDAATVLDRQVADLPRWALVARRVLPPRFAETAVHDGEALTALRGARLMIALRLRRLKTGDYPDGQLSSQDTPADPFSGDAFRCRRTAAGCLLWSVGPDRRDDGGTERKDIVLEIKR